ncbi:FeoA family protein [Halothiobacillus sp. DCM-1]|uniref:FeoA family protein n=1 Tax=Halothiobacillus sp. DCM-1 TaxID=3112558 RepID=UPI003248BEC7
MLQHAQPPVMPLMPARGTNHLAYGLSLATRGARVRVAEIRGASPALAKRLEGMGIHPGTLLEVIQHEGGGLVVRLHASKVALGAGMAHRIFVTDEPGKAAAHG